MLGYSFSTAKLSRLQQAKNDINMKKNKDAAKAAIWYTISDILIKGIGFLTTPIFARILTKTEYGNYNNFLSWTSIFLVIVSLDLSASILRAKYDYAHDLNKYLSSMTALSTVSTIAFMAIVEAYPSFFINFMSMDITFIRVMILYLLFDPAFTYLQTKQRIFYKYKSFAVFAVLSSLLRTAMVLLFVSVFEDRLYGCIIGYVLPVSVFYMLVYVYIMAKGKCVSLAHWKYALSISVPLMPHALANNILSTSDRVMILKMCGAEDAALYSLTYTISMIVSLMRNAFNKAWTPWFFDSLYRKEYSSIQKVSKIYITFILFGMGGLMLIGPELILIFGGAEYLVSKNIIPPVMAGLAYQFLYTLYVNIEIYSKKTFIISIGTVSAAAVNIMLNLLFIPQYGYTAAAYTTAIGYFLLLVFHFLIVKYRIKFSDVIGSRYVYQAVLICFLIHLIVLLLYQNNTIRYMIIFMYAITFLILLQRTMKKIKM